VPRLADLAVFIALVAYKIVGRLLDFRPGAMRPLSLAFVLVSIPLVWHRRRWGQASDLELAIAAYLSLAFLGFWVLPEGLGRLMAAYPFTLLYGLLFLTAAAPLLWGGEPFTCHFARRLTPQEVWGTELFKQVNRALSAWWAALFALSGLLSLLPDLWPALDSPGWRFACTGWLPVLLLVGAGIPATVWYPAYRKRQPAFEPSPQARQEL
jgi:hypothetical protein